MRPSTPIHLSEIGQMAAQGVATAEVVRMRALSPLGDKRPPTFSVSDVVGVLGKSIDWLKYRIRDGKEPKPVREGRRLYYSLEQMQQFCHENRREYLRPAGVQGLVLTVCNYKGGSTKTSTTVTLAQGLSLRGHKVLVVDCDPQGSATVLTGIAPDPMQGQTIMAALTGEAQAKDLIRTTYWSGLDLIAAAPILNHVESLLPQIENYWQSMAKVLEPLRKDYDVILIDTPPTLSLLPLTCLMAADGMVIPVIPNALDFVSSTQFLSVFAEIGAAFDQYGETPKAYEFVKVFLSRVDKQDQANASDVREMMRAAYGSLLMEVEIPKNTLMTGASTTFGTIYDEPKYRIPRPRLMRAKQPYEDFTQEIERSLCAAWARLQSIQ